MKKIHVLMLLLLLIITGSCASLYVTTKQMMKVEEGMSQREVKNILGSPDLRRFDGGIEEWQYRRISLNSSSTYVVMIVRFMDKQVIGMDTFDDLPTHASPCGPNEISNGH